MEKITFEGGFAMVYGSLTGLIHLIASVFALIFGTWVLVAEKGTSLHRKVGYFYAVSMTVLIITALLIYRLFGGFGIFHAAAVISLVTLICGMLPVVLRKPKKTWLDWHFASMYWSVIGLYAAFTAEILTRIPQTKFFWMVGLATFGVMIAANLFFAYRKKHWQTLAAAHQKTIKSSYPEKKETA